MKWRTGRPAGAETSTPCGCPSIAWSRRGGGTRAGSGRGALAQVDRQAGARRPGPPRARPAELPGVDRRRARRVAAPPVPFYQPGSSRPHRARASLQRPAILRSRQAQPRRLREEAERVHVRARRTDPEPARKAPGAGRGWGPPTPPLRVGPGALRPAGAHGRQDRRGAGGAGPAAGPGPGARHPPARQERCSSTSTTARRSSSSSSAGTLRRPPGWCWRTSIWATSSAPPGKLVRTRDGRAVAHGRGADAPRQGAAAAAGEVARPGRRRGPLPPALPRPRANPESRQVFEVRAAIVERHPRVPRRAAASSRSRRR